MVHCGSSPKTGLPTVLIINLLELQRENLGCIILLRGEREHIYVTYIYINIYLRIIQIDTANLPLRGNIRLLHLFLHTITIRNDNAFFMQEYNITWFIKNIFEKCKIARKKKHSRMLLSCMKLKFVLPLAKVSTQSSSRLILARGI